MKNILQPYLNQSDLIILDGALATELENQGANLNDPLWSAKLLIEAPSLIQQIHEDYFVAGADVGITATYQATFEGFQRRGIDRQAATALIQKSVILAIAARDSFWADPAHRVGRLKPLVAASIGPYGAYLADGSEYRGDYGLNLDELMAFHRPRMKVLAESGADLLACETIPSLLEGQALIQLLKEFPTTQAWLSFSCRNHSELCHGEPFAECATLADQSEQILAVGVNCTAPIYVEALLQSAAPYTQKLLLAYPNSGEGWDAANHQWLAVEEGTQFCDFAQRWYDAGARLLGGCCRTGPAEIEKMRNRLSLTHNSTQSPTTKVLIKEK